MKLADNHPFAQYWDKLDRIGRYRLAKFPTPLLPMHRLRRLVGSEEFWVKRDDLISFGLGGNKVRGLEFLMADALTQAADIIVTGAGAQSNHVRATAFASTHCGLRSASVLWGEPPDVIDGNYRVTSLLGSMIEFTGDSDRASVDRGIISLGDTLCRQGYNPYLIPRGGACPLGVLGHTLAVFELNEQCIRLNIRPDAVVLATGSGGTHAGWLLGTRLLQASWRVESVTVSREAAVVRDAIARLATEAAAMIGLDWSFPIDEVMVHDGYIGEGYGMPSHEAAEAILLVGCAEGILLDPTYTGKAMAGLLDRIRLEPRQYRSVIFLHTGGEPAFFAGRGCWLPNASE
ncbi:MAG: 1-aminocyclopropane-1-carboxylate deaminase/D-cysteine desulfhydrase [Gammaproteobacteria bacterium]